MTNDRKGKVTGNHTPWVLSFPSRGGGGRPVVAAVRTLSLQRPRTRCSISGHSGETTVGGWSEANSTLAAEGTTAVTKGEDPPQTAQVEGWLDGSVTGADNGHGRRAEPGGWEGRGVSIRSAWVTSGQSGPLALGGMI